MKVEVRGAVLAFALLTGTQPASAQNDGALTIKTELEKLTPVEAGKPPQKTYVEPQTVTPGDRIRYTLTFRNQGTEPAGNIKVDDPIPEGVSFEETNDHKDFSVSTDGGKTFGALDAATTANADGSRRAASPADVTHVRWLWTDPVPPGQTRSVAFFGKVK